MDEQQAVPVSVGMPDPPDIQPFDVTESDSAYPAGRYLFALGGISAVYPKDEATSVADAVLNDIWVLKFLGNTDGAKPVIRITMKEGKPVMEFRGSKIVERYPNPSKQPNMSWKAAAFFSKFEGAIELIPLGTFDANGDMKTKKVVDWKKVAQKYGTVFSASIIYTKSKKDGKTYRNFDYETLTVTAQAIPVEDMKKIEQMYNSLKAQSKATVESAPEKVEDLPF
jgi:hypothetical protein